MKGQGANELYDRIKILQSEMESQKQDTGDDEDDEGKDDLDEDEDGDDIDSSQDQAGLKVYGGKTTEGRLEAGDLV